MKELTLEITGKCDVGCPWCSSDAKPVGVHMPMVMVESLLKRYRSECDVVRFSGGEPTLHPKLTQFCSLAKELGYYVVLLTNGNQEHVPVVDKYVIGVANMRSLLAVRWLRANDHDVCMEVVLVEGNGKLIREAVSLGLLLNVSLRLLVLQKQGRGKDCRPSELISWTGDKGCRRDEKISVLHDGRVITCSALKEGECALNLKVDER